MPQLRQKRFGLGDGKRHPAKNEDRKSCQKPLKVEVVSSFTFSPSIITNRLDNKPTTNNSNISFIGLVDKVADIVLEGSIAKRMKLSVQNLFVMMALFERMAVVRCFASASRFVSTTTSGHPHTIAFGNRFRGGSSLQSTLNKEFKASLSEIAEQSHSVAGDADNVNSFGGLTFQDCTNQYRVVFVLGGPGAGKGTQSELLLKNYPCLHLSAGQLLREEVKKEDSPHGAVIAERLEAGQIVPVEISLSLLEQAMKKETRKSTVFLVDGFPRNFDNLDGWTKCMRNVAVVSGVLFYSCPLEVLESRILERAKVSGRSDDNLESLRKRFKTFEDETVPVIDTLRLVEKATALQVYDINSDQSVDDVWTDTQRVMDGIVGEDILAENSKLLNAIAMNDADAYRALCVDEMVGDGDPASILSKQEGELCSKETQISGAEIKFISGTKASVSYDLKYEEGKIRESRVWTHDETGWKMLHFSRSSKP